MKLVDLIPEIERINEELIIFQEDTNDFNSDIILSPADDNDGGVKEENGRTYQYLIEVFLAKEFIEDWVSGLNYSPTQNEIAKRLHEYAMNDA